MLFYKHLFLLPVCIMMVHSNFDAKNLLSICLQISPQIFSIVQNFAMDNLRDQQFCTLLCELELVVVVLFTGNALEVEVPPGMVWLCHKWRAFILVPGNVDFLNEEGIEWIQDGSQASGYSYDTND